MIDKLTDVSTTQTLVIHVCTYSNCVQGEHRNTFPRALQTTCMCGTGHHISDALLEVMEHFYL